MLFLLFFLFVLLFALNFVQLELLLTLDCVLLLPNCHRSLLLLVRSSESGETEFVPDCDSVYPKHHKCVQCDPH